MSIKRTIPKFQRRQRIYLDDSLPVTSLLPIVAKTNVFYLINSGRVAKILDLRPELDRKRLSHVRLAYN